MNMVIKKQKSVKRGALDLKVKIIDWTPINKAISEKVGVEVECRLGTGLIKDVTAIFDKKQSEKETKSLIIDKECCGVRTEKRNFYFSDINEGVPFSTNIFEEIGFYKVSRNTENGFRVAMFPSYYFSIDIYDIKKCLTSEEKSLFEFMESRYGYNPRIDSNEMEILRLVYQNDLLEGKKEWMKEEIVEVNW